jgi:hypothetical protein
MLFEPAHLMKKILAAIVVLTLSAGCYAQGVSATSNAVKDLLVLNETSFDFGKIQQSRPVTHEFQIRNESNDTLKLDNVQASCGCTTPVWKKEPVKPGGNTTVNVGYNAASEGPFEKLVTIYYNAGQTKTLTIKGNVFKAATTPAPPNSSIQLLKQTSQ